MLEAATRGSAIQGFLTEISNACTGRHCLSSVESGNNDGVQCDIVTPCIVCICNRAWCVKMRFIARTTRLVQYGLVPVGIFEKAWTHYASGASGSINSGHG